MLSVRNLNFEFGDKKIFEDASLEVGATEKVALWAPNGSGKTTFFKILTGLLPARGEISFDGRVCSTPEDFVWLRKKLGFVLQYASDQLFFPEVLEDVAFGPLNLGLSREEAKKAAEKALDQVGLRHLSNALSFELSGGQKKLVALASVLSMNPQMILFDEPTAGLDSEARHRFIHILQELKQPWIMISHDPDLLLKTCDRFCTIKDHRFEDIPKPVTHEHVHTHFLGEMHHSH